MLKINRLGNTEDWGSNKLKQTINKLIFLMSYNTQSYYRGLNQCFVILRSGSRKHYLPERSTEPWKARNLAGSILEWHGEKKKKKKGMYYGLLIQ